MRKVPPLHRKARIAWNSQVQRCTNSNQNCFKNYGARGIRVEYSFEEFRDWYIREFSKKKWKCASVGRIDHDKNYTLGNIEMVEHADNAREMYARTGGNEAVRRKPVVLVGSDITHVFGTIKAAAKFAGVTEAYVCFRKRFRADPNKKSRFPYEVYDFDEFMEGAPWSPSASNSADTQASASA